MKTYRQSIIIGCLTLFLTAFGVLEPVERALLSLRFSLDERSASGALTVVQIDARTIKELGVWPFERTHHARAIDKLRGQAPPPSLLMSNSLGAKVMQIMQRLLTLSNGREGR